MTIPTGFKMSQNFLFLLYPAQVCQLKSLLLFRRNEEENIRKIHLFFFLGALAKFRKVTLSFVISDRLSLNTSVRMEQLGFHWMDFHEISYLFSKICRENSSVIKI